LTLELAVSRLVNQVAHWTPARWSKPVASGAGTRADAMHALVQRLADAAADAEGSPQRPVPRLANDLALPDQLRVVSADLIAADPDRANASTDMVRTTAAQLRTPTPVDPGVSCSFDGVSSE
jgi:hypothetical protein